MQAINLISQAMVPLRTSDTGEDTLSIMSDFFIRHLPIVNNETLLGLISEEDILNHDVEEAVGSYQLSMTRPYANEHDHIYEVLRLFTDFQLTTVPVVGEKDIYRGMITQEDLLRYLSNISSISEPGGIIILEMTRRDYSMSEIARIVESEGAVILNSFITSVKDSTRIDVTLKVNRRDNLRPILATFARFDYQIKASFFETEAYDSMKERYNLLMTYLNV